MSLQLDDPISVLPGVGTRAVRLYARLGIHRVWDLITHWPRQEAFHLEHHGEAAHQARDGEVVHFVATIDAWTRTPRRGKKVGTVTLTDDLGTRWVSTFFQRWPHWLERQFPVGSVVEVNGKVTHFGGRPYLQQLKLASASSRDDQLNGSSIGVVYPATQGLASATISKDVQTALRLVGELDEWLPEQYVATHHLMGADEAIRTMHEPPSSEALTQAQARLVYEELFALQVALQRNRNIIKGAEHGIMNAVVTNGVCDHFHSRLPFALTSDQITVMGEIDRDMGSPHPMHRLIQGDVGTGKTIVAAHAMLRAIDAGRQAVLMVPTQVLAEQHASTLRDLLQDMVIERYGRFLTIDVLSANDTKSERRRVCDGLASGLTDLVVATHAVLEPSVQFADLGLVVIDEQHRFGVEHRRSLTDKRVTGDSPDLLVMTATPIPRSIALTLYGDLDVSTIKTRPGGGRITVKTIALEKTSPRREGLYDFIAQEVSQGRKAYVVCPLIEPRESQDNAIESNDVQEDSGPTLFVDTVPGGHGWDEVASVRDVHRTLQERFSPTPVGMLHGRMRSVEREAVMEDFRAGTVPILVATTVIEVGVSVDESSVMIIEDADRFGISQLHQLRGRLFRGYPDNYCVLFSSKDPEDNPRLQAMVATADGFELAEIDLQLRREGAVFGTNQTGAGELAFANLLTDLEVVAQTRADVAALLADDPDLVGYPRIVEQVNYRHPDDHVIFADAG
ncbi:ATP-dependent DNA helicase RecG [Stomatohabitans albus]|uniref:ATP-dependent DNA helicase RecG n=1 Tax=Stomatohabitans albus TaxID=3110766 RepID=UPI00300C7CE8